MSMDGQDIDAPREEITTSYASLESDSLRYRSSSGVGGGTGTGGGSSASPLSLGTDDFINVQELDPTAVALQKCESYVLTPYRTVLKILGWTPFSRDGDGKVLKVIRFVLVSFWVLVILTTFITQILSCFRRDTFTPGVFNNVSNTSVVMCNRHIISNFVLPDLLLLASYLFGLYLFSKDETEYLSNLAEKVFIKNANIANRDANSNLWLIVTIACFLLAALVWILLSFGVRWMTSFSVELWKDAIVISWNDSVMFKMAGKIVLVVFAIIGFLFFDTVYVSAVMNYAAQSEMNIYLLRAVRKRVVQKEYTDMDTAIKDILECRQYLRVLNGKTATATALILFNLGSAALVGIINLDRISTKGIPNDALATVTASFNVVLWTTLVFFPFIQAARVTDACNKLKATGPEIRARPLQYVNTPQIDLDSYMGLTQVIKMRATMFGIPIYPWLVWLIIVAFTFIALILFQTGIYSFTVYL